MSIYEAENKNSTSVDYRPADIPIQTIRKEILEEAEKCVCGQREEDYGSPEDNFRLIAEFWSSYTGADISAKDVAVMMALLKIARIKTGYKKDNFVDLAGYAACAGEVSNKEGENVQKEKKKSDHR